MRSDLIEILVWCDLSFNSLPYFISFFFLFESGREWRRLRLPDSVVPVLPGEVEDIFLSCWREVS